MKLSFANNRVLAVLAHPDDAELLCAGTLARAKADGAAIAICIMCRGDKGTPASPATADVSTIRRAEAEAAATLLAAQLHWQDHPDGELFDTYPARLKLVETYRRFRPTLVIAHSANDYHPDHRAASALAEAASWFAASAGHVTSSLHPLDAPPALWWADTVAMTGFEPHFYVDVSAQVALKQQMLDCHRSQIARADHADFTSLSAMLQRQSEARGAQCGVLAAEAFRTSLTFKRARAF